LSNAPQAIAPCYTAPSWFPQIRESRFYSFIDRLVEPMLRPIRQVLPYMGGIDISPMILIFILLVIDRLIGR